MITPTAHEAKAIGAGFKEIERIVISAGWLIGQRDIQPRDAMPEHCRF
jgi:hypothetical protein